MKKTVLFVLVLVFGLVPKGAKADFTFGMPTNLGSTVNSSGNDYITSMTSE